MRHMCSFACYENQVMPLIRPNKNGQKVYRRWFLACMLFSYCLSIYTDIGPCLRIPDVCPPWLHTKWLLIFRHKHDKCYHVWCAITASIVQTDSLVSLIMTNAHLEIISSFSIKIQVPPAESPIIHRVTIPVAFC